MENFLAVCLGILVIAVTILSVFLIQTIIQLKNTARSVERLVDSVSQEVLRIHNVTNVVSNITGAVGTGVGKSIALLTSLLIKTLRGTHQRAERSSSETESSNDQRPAYQPK
ncbi:MAG: hypothetical protein HY548_10150 [Elusimicrobia bacterium]|nr:hypothetical protein [Elusimicrobiota bacterium]